MSDNEKLIGKTIVWAEINGFGIKLEFSDGSVLDYSSSDNGYSCWKIIEHTMEEFMYGIQDWGNPEDGSL